MATRTVAAAVGSLVVSLGQAGHSGFLASLERPSGSSQLGMSPVEAETAVAMTVMSDAEVALAQADAPKPLPPVETGVAVLAGVLFIGACFIFCCKQEQPGDAYISPQVEMASRASPAPAPALAPAAPRKSWRESLKEVGQSFKSALGFGPKPEAAAPAPVQPAEPERFLPSTGNFGGPSSEFGGMSRVQFVPRWHPKPPPAEEPAAAPASEEAPAPPKASSVRSVRIADEVSVVAVSEVDTSAVEATEDAPPPTESVTRQAPAEEPVSRKMSEQEVSEEMVKLGEQVAESLQKMEAMRQQIAIADKEIAELTAKNPDAAVADSTATQPTINADASFAVPAGGDLAAKLDEKEKLDSALETMIMEFHILAQKCEDHAELYPEHSKVKEMMATVRAEEEKIAATKRDRAGTASKFGPTKAGGRRGTLSSRKSVKTQDGPEAGSGGGELAAKLAKRRTMETAQLAAVAADINQDEKTDA